MLNSHLPLQKVKESARDNNGSLIVFISFLFLVALIISLGIVDVSDSFLAKRELISAGEDLLSAGVQQIDLSRYYQNGIDPGTSRVPINCAEAISIMQSLVSDVSVRGVHPILDSIECVQDSLSISLSLWIKPLVTIPFISSFSGRTELITAHLNEASIVK
jgi:hypothetical protein